MSQNFKKVLHNEGLQITFLVEEDLARVEYRSNSPLAGPDDLVLVVNGKGVPIELTSETTAIAHLGPWDALSNAPVSLMTRVDEFFDGWEFDP